MNAKSPGVSGASGVLAGGLASEGLPSKPPVKTFIASKSLDPLLAFFVILLHQFFDCRFRVHRVHSFLSCHPVDGYSNDVGRPAEALGLEVVKLCFGCGRQVHGGLACHDVPFLGRWQSRPGGVWCFYNWLG